MAKRLNVVFDDESLYRTLKVEAARRGVPARRIVCEALEMWLEARENEEDIAISLEAYADYREHGGLAAQEVHAEVDRTLAERQQRPSP